jgi:hypothetical protein
MGENVLTVVPDNAVSYSELAQLGEILGGVYTCSVVVATIFEEAIGI